MDNSIKSCVNIVASEDSESTELVEGSVPDVRILCFLNAHLTFFSDSPLCGALGGFGLGNSVLWRDSG